MISLLARLFIKNFKQYSSPDVRRMYGTLCSVVAIGLNICLVIAKLITANISGSFSIHADALNNLADVGSSLLLLLAFYFAGMLPRPDRPFGHGRIEYVAGLIVSGLVIFFGIELARGSIRNIITPPEMTFSWLTMAVLAASIGVKCYMSFFMIQTSKKIESEALHATGLDSLSDTISTLAAACGMLIFQFTPGHWNLDGWLGLFVSILVLKAGIESGKATLWQLLGTKPSPELVNQIKDICMKYDDVIGIHDLVVHDYGPGRLHVSIHCEVPGDHSIYELHDTMDIIMRELDEKIGCESVIHMDPVCTDDCKVADMRTKLQKAISKMGHDVYIHDFRIIEGPTHTNVIFDCVVPFDVEKDSHRAEEKVKAIVSSLWENTFAVVKIDRPYV